MEDKKALRKRLRALRDSVGDDRMEYSQSICLGCLSINEVREAKTLLLYFAKDSEVDLSSLAQMAFAMGKTVGFPRCRDDGTITFHAVTSLFELEAGNFGLMEPSESAPLCDLGRDAVCIVPAIAYDKDGYRLGYGGGYYDKFLKVFCGCSIGVAYDLLVQDKLPREEHDQKTDYIVTESQVKRTIEG